MIHQGDCRDILPTLAAESVQCCVTSPPYWGGLRDYGDGRQVSLEREPSEYVTVLTSVLRLVSRVIALDGTLWLNVGDVYAASGKGGGGSAGGRVSWKTVRDRKGFRMPPPGYKMKDLTLVPFLLADALRRDGWYLRSTIIWHKPAAVEPMRLDRPAVSHEYLFLLSRQQTYFTANLCESWWGHSVWLIPSDRTPDHPATMPRELARRCILAGSKPGDTILDPFSGAGTTGFVAKEHGREYVGIELNPEYIAISERRMAQNVLALETA